MSAQREQPGVGYLLPLSHLANPTSQRHNLDFGIDRISAIRLEVADETRQRGQAGLPDCALPSGLALHFGIIERLKV